MYSDTGDTTSLVPGFPIRTSSDQRSVGSSPRHIAASHVLHRLLMPRHPPCALKHLQTQKNNSTKTLQIQQFCLDARNHYPIKQTPHPTTKMERHHLTRPRKAKTTQVLPQDPIVCRRNCRRLARPGRQSCCAPSRRPLQTTDSSRLTPPPIEDVSRGAP
jgi:hypothetical protein